MSDPQPPQAPEPGRRNWSARRQVGRVRSGQVYYDHAEPAGAAPATPVRERTSPAWRAWQLSALTLSALSLGGYAVLNASGGEARRVMAAVPGEAPHLTLLVAGRDIVYCAPYTPCKDQDTRKVWQPPNTDSIMLIKVDGSKINVLSIPRDTNVGPYDPNRGPASQKVNSQYWSSGLQGLSSAVEEITGERVDYTAVVRTDYVERVIGALGGLDVTVPDIAAYGHPDQRGIQFDDNAANLHVHLQPGPHHLDGKQAVAYLRMRKGVGDDYGRMDHQKQALSQLVGKLKSPGRLAAALPVIVGGLSNGVDTNADAGLVQSLTPALSQVRLNFATLPTNEIPGSYNLAADREALARLWNDDAAQGTAGAKAASVVVEDASGHGLGPRFVKALRQAGYSTVKLQTVPASPEHTQVFTQTEPRAAENLADLLNVSRLQGRRFPVGDGEIGVLLGEDANTLYAALPH
ncbi:LCP family protein [Deinococcus aquiradiocola]|uniref:LytR family transcriptional regulator n=1 Tax=Deinococcus aquiradiocola TaxID=393059 RepID=A0A917PNP2_9DEIO|nr:LCP family protein [Deinococcus aquiradiocola]GGJ85587.1 LytR family transcriptional regulator [Deinococcus aquiradiocola]